MVCPLIADSAWVASPANKNKDKKIKDKDKKIKTRTRSMRRIRRRRMIRRRRRKRPTLACTGPAGPAFFDAHRGLRRPAPTCRGTLITPPKQPPQTLEMANTLGVSTCPHNQAELVLLWLHDVLR